MAYIDAKGNVVGTGAITPGGAPTQVQTPAPVQPTNSGTPPVPPPQAYNTNPPAVPQGQQSAPQQPQQGQQGAPTANLQPGSKGADVLALQNYLVQTGVATPDQFSSGPGIYGPQTTAAVAKMQQDLGLNPSTGKGSYGPQTQAALAQKYQNLYSSQKGKEAPKEGSSATGAIQDATATSTDPIFGTIVGAMAPILQSLQQVMSNINNPALTGVSLQQEYNQLSAQNGLPTMQADLLNMNRIMSGTTEDIRSEVAAVGGFATESQVQGMSAARNNVILKQYNALATQYQAATTNVQNMMQYSSQDQATNLQKQSMQASVAESIAGIEQGMVQMGMQMRNNAVSAAQFNVQQMGYKGVAAAAQGNPQALNQQENLLGLAPGTLSDASSLQRMDTYKDQTAQLNMYKAAISAYNAGYGGAPPGTYSSPAPMTPSNPGGVPPGSGTQAVSDNLLLSPHDNTNNKSLMQATGLGFLQFSMLTGNTSAYTRMSQGQKQKLVNSVDSWLKNHGNVDVSTFLSQYKAQNDTLQSNIQRFNNTSIAEGEVLGSLQNLAPTASAANLQDLNVANVAKIMGGQQINDPTANEYAFYFGDLQKSLAYFYAAQTGKSSAELTDHEDAANVIKAGLAKGGIKGLESAIKNTTAKMKVVLGGAVDNSQKNVWSLFGVGDQYTAPSQNMVAVKDPSGQYGNIPASQLTDALSQGYTFGNPISLPAFPGLDSQQ